MINPNGAVDGNSQNVPEAQVPRTRSTFPLHYHFFNTHRFGEYIPHYVEDANKDENFPIHSAHDLRSYTLDSPLMQNVKRNKDYFMVPLEAILPLNWEKFFDNPVRGDDVLDDVGPSVENFWRKVGQLNNALNGQLSSILGNTSTTAPVALQATLRYLILMEYFYSNGNLLASLGNHGAPYAQISFTGSGGSNRPRSFDEVFDAFLTTISSGMGSGSFTMLVDGYSYVVVVGTSGAVWPGQSSITLRHALQLMRDNPSFQITSWSGASTAASFVSSLAGTLGSWTITPILADVPCDLSRLWAYQLCCAHYFSNDHIDFVYSAELFRQLIGGYILRQTASSFTSGMTFSRNGIIYRYDYLAGHFATLFFAQAVAGANNLLTLSGNVTYNSLLGYFSALFGYRRSLRYLDYFTGSRAQPLAVVSTNVNTNVSVNNNLVSVIDITKSIQAQRFLNSVNRVRHNFEGYLKGIFGGKLPAPDYHNPFYLAHTDDVIFGQETENTGAAQVSDPIAITTNLRSSSNNYMFDCHTDRPCIIIGITSYDITRVYTKSMERAFLKVNRFDYFNPFMQYIGDQPIYIQELGINPVSGQLSTLKNFSYTIRHEEYKQRFNQAAGGFVQNLPGWIFIASDERGTQTSINPDWIRSVNAEFDRFYVSLTGWSLGSYFHFIVDDFNSVNASRPMAYAPQILG